MPPRAAKSAALAVGRALLPVHKFSWSDGRGRRRLRRHLRKFSPLVDYYDAYQQSGEKLPAAWALLDTHDTLTDYYKHLRSADGIATALRACGPLGV